MYDSFSRVSRSIQYLTSWAVSVGVTTAEKPNYQFVVLEKSIERDDKLCEPFNVSGLFYLQDKRVGPER